MKREFSTSAQAQAFASSISNILDIGYKSVGRNAKTGEAINAWVVEWDEPTFDELYPARSIEL